jgi:hypothetical protein
MKVEFTAIDNKIGYYVWRLGRNLLQNKRSLRRLAKTIDCGDGPNLEFIKGTCSEAHNRFYAAKDYFNKEISKNG